MFVEALSNAFVAHAFGAPDALKCHKVHSE